MKEAKSKGHEDRDRAKDADVSMSRATADYEAWLADRITIVDVDLKKKHQNMTLDPFIFLRATFYRWAQVWPSICSDLVESPIVLAVGDLHIENFGTWRDCEGRLIWGVNDFDESYPLPYTNDLVRLATSACLALSANHLAIDLSTACDRFLTGYTDALAAGGRPFVLAEEHIDLREIAQGKLREPVHFWKKLD